MKRTGPILLVDDNPYDIELAVSALEKNNLMNGVVTARNGEEALDYLYRRGEFQNRTNGDPILIFLDLKMPKVDGFEVLRQIKGDESLKIIPVVMLTSSDEESDLLKTYQLGTNAYVVKPVEFEGFVEAIRQLGGFWFMLNQPPPAVGRVAS